MSVQSLSPRCQNFGDLLVQRISLDGACGPAPLLRSPRQGVSSSRCHGSGAPRATGLPSVVSTVVKVISLNGTGSCSKCSGKSSKVCRSFTRTSELSVGRR